MVSPVADIQEPVPLMAFPHFVPASRSLDALQLAIHPSIATLVDVSEIDILGQ